MPRIIRGHTSSWLESFASGIIKCGQIPKHVAFIMDGNRRYANKTNIDRADGHKQGFETLAKVLSWCRELGIHHVTLYAFSIENFKRTRDEVDSIMNLAREKCDSLLDELDQVNEAGIRVNIAGDLSMLPEDIRLKIGKIQDMTSNNNKAVLNICLAYTSRHEIVSAIKRISTLVHRESDTLGKRSIKPEDVDLQLLEQNLFLSRPFPEIIIRTSGEVRLSDFMLWQCQESMLMFVDALWPEISFWDLLKAIFYFQYHSRFIKNYEPTRG